MEPRRKLATKTIYPIGSSVQTTGRHAIVLLHGFTQNSAVMAPFARLLANLCDRTVILVDLPGHGESSHLVLDLRESAEVLAEMFGPSIFVGYSLGGRILFHLAARHPEIVTALVVMGSNPGIADPVARSDRLGADLALAAAIDKDPSRNGLENFLMRWLASPIFGGIDPSRAGLAARLSNDPHALAESMARTSLGTQADMRSALANFSGEILYLYGARDEKFAAISSQLVQEVGAHLRTLAIEGSGHWVIGEAPYRSAKAIAAFIDECAIS